MEVFAALFYKLGSANKWHHWMIFSDHLDEVARKIMSNGANPWVFSSDIRHLCQFGRKADFDAFYKLTREELIALDLLPEDDEWDEIANAAAKADCNEWDWS